MKNYYQILGLSKEATTDDIKSAYKTLALKYHPDRNDGSVFAEEQFKNINEAYQILSDTYKKQKYDLVYQYGNRASQYQAYQSYTGANYQNRGNWNKTPRYYKRSVYKIDKDYYREQLYTIGVLLLVIILVTSGTAINNHYAEKKAIEEAIIVEHKLHQAETHFNRYEYDSTFSIINGLIRQYPFEMIYSKHRDDYVKKLHQEGIRSYHEQDYIKAIHELNTAKTHIKRQDLNIWYVIGECHEALESYLKAIDAFDYVFIRESTDIALAMRIGDLYLKIDNKQNALSYYSTAKRIFKVQQSSIYGDAFELVIKPQLLDSSYFYIFKKRGSLNYEFSNYEEASTEYNWAIFLNPSYNEGFAQRAECWHKMGNSYRACLDWNEAYKRGDRSILNKIRQYCGS